MVAIRGRVCGIWRRARWLFPRPYYTTPPRPLSTPLFRLFSQPKNPRPLRPLSHISFPKNFLLKEGGSNTTAGAPARAYGWVRTRARIRRAHAHTHAQARTRDERTRTHAYIIYYIYLYRHRNTPRTPTPHTPAARQRPNAPTSPKNALQATFAPLGL